MPTCYRRLRVFVNMISTWISNVLSAYRLAKIICSFWLPYSEEEDRSSDSVALLMTQRVCRHVYRS